MKYTLVKDDGTPIAVFGRYGKPGAYKSFDAFDKAELGSIVGVKYIGDKVPKTGGNAYKVIDVYVSDQKQPDVLTAYSFGGKVVEESTSELPPF